MSQHADGDKRQRIDKVTDTDFRSCEGPGRTAGATTREVARGPPVAAFDDPNRARTLGNAPFHRRTVLKTIGGGLAAGASAGLAGARSEPDELARQLDGVRGATRDYRDVGTAREAGFEPLLEYFPEMGFHFTDRDPPIGADREDPPVLVYVTNGSYDPEPGATHDPDRDDDLILGGVEYLMSGDREAAPPNVFADEGSARELAVTEAEGWHFDADLDVTALHAWIHRGNPAGVFHPTNPTVD